MQKIIINKLGPIDYAELECTKWMVFIGAQSTGKSTVAKAIFFFRKVGESIFDLLVENTMLTKVSDTENFTHKIMTALSERFMDIFSSFVMSKDTSVQFYYANETYIKISFLLENDINIDFSENIVQYLIEVDADILTYRELSTELSKSFSNSEKNSKWIYRERAKLRKLFEDKYKNIYLPAGRSMISLLAEKLDRMLFTMNDSQKQMLDFCIRCYLEDVLELRPVFNSFLERKLSKKTALELTEKILNATYSYGDGNERLELPNGQHISLSRASSGQQEVVWVTNLLIYSLLHDKQKFAFIIEEPESNLYPETQKQLIDLIALTANQGNNIIITTHSPYILGSINNLLYAGQFAKQNAELATKASKIIDKDFWIDRADLSAWHVKDGTVTNCIDDEIGLIQDELIDEISGVINKEYADLLDIEED
ncbi:MAG: ATP-binding protein [Firmicutes bacterium]|nr:ATP-binding protein [Bacillota bacterium]